MLLRQGLMASVAYVRLVMPFNGVINYLIDNWKGTPDFMTVEVADQLHIVFCHVGGKRIVDYRRWKENREKTLKSINTSRGIYYNYIHDLETIWWIAVWALFNFKKKHARADETDLLAAYIRKINRDILFSGIIGNLNRNRLFRVNSTYTQATRCLPKYFDDFSLTFMTITEAIKDSYVEKGLCGVTNISWDEKSTIHDIFIELLDEVEMGKFEIVYIQTPTTTTKSNKRYSDEQDSEREHKRQRYFILSLFYYDSLLIEGSL